MCSLRFLIAVMTCAPALLVAGCASTPPEQLASRECKVVVADFAGKPSKNTTPIEQAAAEMRMSRLANERGGYWNGPNVFADLARDCN